MKREPELRAIGVDPDRVVDRRDVEYMLGDAFRETGVAFGPEQRELVVCTLGTHRGGHGPYDFHPEDARVALEGMLGPPPRP